MIRYAGAVPGWRTAKVPKASRSQRVPRPFLQSRLPPTFPESAISPNPLPTPAVLCAQDLSFDYPGRPLFAAQSWRIPSGVTWVHGGEGCGKTTLLRLLAGALPLRAGQLQVNGVLLAGQPAAYRQQVFWADPQSEAFEQVTPHDYLASLPGLYPRFEVALWPALVDGLGLAPHLHKPLYMLSTGSKRKVWLAAALASGAPVTLLDEPFAALDLASVHFVLRWLGEAAAHPTRAWLVADYAAPAGVPLASVIDLGEGAV